MSADQYDDQAEAQPPRKSVVEQHIQSILLAIITAAVLYSGTFVIGAREDSVRFTAQIAGLAAEVGALRVQLAAMQTNYTSREEYHDHEARIRTLESGSHARLGAR